MSGIARQAVPSGWRRRPFGTWSLPDLAACTLVLAVLVLEEWHLRRLIPFGDEAETVVASRMLAAGLRLHTGVFEQHGPARLCQANVYLPPIWR